VPPQSLFQSGRRLLTGTVRVRRFTAPAIRAWRGRARCVLARGAPGRDVRTSSACTPGGVSTPSPYRVPGASASPWSRGCAPVPRAGFLPDCRASRRPSSPHSRSRSQDPTPDWFGAEPFRVPVAATGGHGGSTQSSRLYSHLWEFPEGMTRQQWLLEGGRAGLAGAGPRVRRLSFLPIPSRIQSTAAGAARVFRGSRGGVGPPSVIAQERKTRHRGLRVCRGSPGAGLFAGAVGDNRWGGT
jgi:hypothetical protein